MKTLNLISGGAAHGLVARLQTEFEAAHACSLQGTFNAVGVIRELLLSGPSHDVVILTRPLIEQLTASGHIRAGSARSLGLVKTGLAVKTGQAAPPVANPSELQAALRMADGIYFPDPVKATAGIHFFGVLKQLGLDTLLAAKLHSFPNGATAMGALAASGQANGLGCTQVTEILNTPGVQLIGLLPKEFELATDYVAAVCTSAQHVSEAAALIDLLTSPAAATQRQACGFI